ncbi:DUF4871 domain-containing protein [Neobacillus novalis]|uniref:DUF4871 domain-containing protein n=1 Tax=Neobacillus novalis TaxID=220687 RepID=UPI000B3036F1
MKIKSMVFIFLTMFFLVAGCSTNETVESKIVLPKGIPDFVKVNDFETINWDRKAVEFGDRGIFGNKYKSGVIGEEMKSSNIEKWMWHLWGVNKVELTIVGFNKETRTVHPILFDRDTNNWSWTRSAMGAVNGADSHMPSNVKVPEPGEWAILLYTDGKLFDKLVYEINE